MTLGELSVWWLLAASSFSWPNMVWNIPTFMKNSMRYWFPRSLWQSTEQDFFRYCRFWVTNELLIYNPLSFPLYLKLFLQLLDACLKSSLLPAYLAASFTKKLSRLSLSVPPSGSLVITALIYNLLRRHPSINHLVHQVRPIFVSAWKCKKHVTRLENDLLCVIFSRLN